MNKEIRAGMLALMVCLGLSGAGWAPGAAAGETQADEEELSLFDSEETAEAGWPFESDKAAEAGMTDRTGGGDADAEEADMSEAFGTEEENEAGAAASAVTPPAAFRQLSKGSEGEDVRALQLRLLELGYDPGDADGKFGSGTREAVKAFQKRNGLSVDGIAGKQTQTVLYSAEALSPLPPPEPTDVLAGDWPMLTNLQYPVEENFVPADLVLLTELCDPGLIKIKYPETQAVQPAVEALITMLEAARADGITNWQCSAAYRSYADQEKMLTYRINQYLKKNPDWSRSRARRAALKTVAEPGASEHHLGLAFDVNVPGTSAFAGTKQCAWLHANCWEFGFIIRYQEGKEQITGFTPEAWHIRYVGQEHAMKMWEEDLCLEEYLERYHPQE